MFFRVRLYHGKRQPAGRTVLGRRLDNNVDIPAQPGQAFQQPVLRNPAKTPFQEGGNLGLRQPQDLCSAGLGKPSPLNDLGDLGGQLGLNQHALAIRVAEVGIHVP